MSLRTRRAAFGVGMVSMVALTGPAWASEWMVIGDRGGVLTSTKSMAGDKITANRGVMDVDIEPCKLVSYSLVPNEARNWVDLLIEYDVEFTGPNEMIARQLYDMPWPVADREIVLLGTIRIQEDPETYEVYFESVDSERYPQPTTDSVIRSHVHFNLWRFSETSEGHTRIEVESHVDPKGTIPAWLVNLTSRSWAYNTLTAFTVAARDYDVERSQWCVGD